MIRRENFKKVWQIYQLAERLGGPSMMEHWLRSSMSQN